MTGNNYNFLAFFGGFMGAMTHYITNIKIMLNIKMDELLDFTVHSLIGGTIMLAVKVLGEWILYKIKKVKQHKDNTFPNE